MKLSKKHIFACFSLFFLLIGLLGIKQAAKRPGLRFEWKYEKAAVVVSAVIAGDGLYHSKLKKGDYIKQIAEELGMGIMETHRWLLDIAFQAYDEGQKPAVETKTVRVKAKMTHWFHTTNLERQSMLF